MMLLGNSYVGSSSGNSRDQDAGDTRYRSDRSDKDKDRKDSDRTKSDCDRDRDRDRDRDKTRDGDGRRRFDMPLRIFQSDLFLFILFLMQAAR
jgi:hypothetical protein